MNLDVAIEQLYETFARYRLNGPIEYCPCCHTAEEIGTLQATPVRDLAEEPLGHFTASLLLTAGFERDFKHFLPRIFDLAAPENRLSVDPQITFGKLRLADWCRWPTSEQRAIRRYLMACWEQVLATPTYDFVAFVAPSDADSYLCAIAQAEDDLTPYLTEWSKLDTLPALAHLAYSVPRDWSAFAYWSARQAQWEQVADYMLAPRTIKRLKRAVFTFETEEVSAVMSDAVEELCREKKRRGADS